MKFNPWCYICRTYNRSPLLLSESQARFARKELGELPCHEAGRCIKEEERIKTTKKNLNYIEARKKHFKLISLVDSPLHKIKVILNVLICLLPRRFRIRLYLSRLLLRNLIVRKMGVRFYAKDFWDLKVMDEDYEKELSRWYDLNRGDIFIDVGANVGRYTLLMSKKVGNGKVYSFEPCIDSLVRLHTNIKLNNITNAVVFPVALWDKTDVKKFFIKENCGKNSILDEKNTVYETFVLCVRLDDIVELLDLKRIDLIKIDVEGAEKEVLLGMRNTIEEYSPNIIIESLPHNNEWVKKFLERYNYVEVGRYRTKLKVLNQLWRQKWKRDLVL